LLSVGDGRTAIPLWVWITIPVTGEKIVRRRGEGGTGKIFKESRPGWNIRGSINVADGKRPPLE
jgi:hypothetical protein